MRKNPKGLQAKSSPECSEPELAAMRGDSPRKRGNLYNGVYFAGKQTKGDDMQIGPQGILAEINRYFISEPCSLAEIPGTWSSASEPQQGLLLSSSADDKIEVDGKIVDGTMLVTLMSAIRYIHRITATVISPDGINYGIRIWDSDSDAIRNFDGISSYPYNPEWVVKAAYLSPGKHRTVSFELFNQAGLNSRFALPRGYQISNKREAMNLLRMHFSIKSF
ncbi:hypothetical protein [Paenibacillus durus]|uniref:hypothetical protein n=1 Tax=Paenibacillus durus TaxID=44251 RepID=UPI0011874F6F|nr:hypothetical protein [Paenibacillus durus]